MTTLGQHFRASAAELWTVLSDPDRYGDWVVGAKDSSPGAGQWPEPGSKFNHRVGIGPIEIRDETEVQINEAGQYLRMEARFRPVGVALIEFRLEPAADGSDLTMTETVVKPDWLVKVHFLVDPGLRLRNRMSLQRLSRLVDGGGHMPDAVVIGAGHNGLVAANLLADAGWDVVVVEAQDSPGGAVRTEELTLPGFHHDVFSAFYPLSAVSPVLAGLALQDHGLRWKHAPLVQANPFPDGSCVTLSTEPGATAASFDSFSPGDGAAWRALYGLWDKANPSIVDALFTPFPPVRHGAALAARLGYHDLVRMARLAVLPVRRLSEENFGGVGAPTLLAGNALHTDLSPEAAGSGIFGWLLTCLGQQVGFPVPAGGARSLIDALVRRLESKGGRVCCSSPVAKVLTRQGGAVGVRLVDGTEIDATKAVLANVSAPALYLELLSRSDVPPHVLDAIGRFQWDASTVKVDWALSSPTPWTAPAARQAGTVHIADDIDNLTEVAAHLATSQIPARPFLLFGQQSIADTSRAPEGCDTAWAYTHVPRRVRGDAGGDLSGDWDGGDGERFADRMEDRVEALAPGFKSRILARHVLSPNAMEARNANLKKGAINNGTAQIHQQLIFRPVPGLGRAATPIRNLYLASATAHPGGGVHGGPGAIAARSALAAVQRRRLLRNGAPVALVAAGASAAALRAGHGQRR